MTQLSGTPLQLPGVPTNYWNKHGFEEAAQKYVAANRIRYILSQSIRPETKLAIIFGSPEECKRALEADPTISSSAEKEQAHAFYIKQNARLKEEFVMLKKRRYKDVGLAGATKRLLEKIDAILQSIGLARYTPVGVEGRKTVNRMRLLFQNKGIDISNLPEPPSHKKPKIK